MQIIKLMAAAIGMLALAACQSANNPAAWGQIAAGVATVKDMRSGRERRVPLDELLH